MDCTEAYRDYNCASLSYVSEPRLKIFPVSEYEPLSRISCVVFGVAFACCIPVFRVDVLVRSAFRAVCVVPCWLRIFFGFGIPTRQGHSARFPNRTSQSFR